MLDLDALAHLESRLSGDAAEPALRSEPPRPLARPPVSEDAVRRCPHLAALAEQDLEAAE
ncbi:MAG: hypothetical protein R6V44_07885 [Paracoccaceae bacterium]